MLVFYVLLDKNRCPAIINIFINHVFLEFSLCSQIEYVHELWQVRVVILWSFDWLEEVSVGGLGGGGHAIKLRLGGNI